MRSPSRLHIRVTLPRYVEQSWRNCRSWSMSESDAMSAERFLNSYQNASTPPGPDVPPQLAAFMLAVDPVLVQTAELARVLARAHQGAATQLIGQDWSHARDRLEGDFTEQDE